MERFGFIFDLDGTLIDSNGVWEKIDREFFKKYRLSCTDEEARAAAAMTYDELLVFIEKKGLSFDLKRLKDELDNMAAKEYAENIPLKSGAKEYLLAVRSGGGRTALATASPERLYAPVLKRFGLYGLFDAFCTTDEAGASKDCPDVYLLAAKRLGIPPERCFVFEDSPAGIISAASVGMHTVAVYDRFSTKDPDRIKQTADRFILSFDELPLNAAPIERIQ